MIKTKANWFRVLVAFGSIVTACGVSPEVTKLTEVSSNSVGCPETPPQSSMQDTELVNLQYQRIRNLGTVNQSNATTYQFQGRKGQAFEFSISPGLCAWLYTDDNTLLARNPSLSVDALPKDGSYLLQVSAEKKQVDFELKMAIEPFDQSDYPMAECGDRKPDDPSVYPVKFYPVNIPSTGDNLTRAKSLFCRDAYRKRSESRTGYTVQVASFLDREKAVAFSRFLSSTFDAVVISKPTTLEVP
jgi:hypothetical protein